MYALYLAVQIITFIIAIGLFIKIARARPTKVQASCLSLIATDILLTLAYFIDITGDTTAVVCAAVKLEYIALCMITSGNTWFCSEFCRFKVPKGFYIFQGFMASAVIVQVMTLEYHTLHYEKIEMIYNGFYTQGVITPGKLYALPYAYFVLTDLWVMYKCIRVYLKSTGMDKKRVGAILIGSFCPMFSIILRSTELLGKIELQGFGFFGAAMCYAIAVLKYGYFDSVQSATENALEYGKEGFIVTNVDGEVLHVNRLARQLFPEMAKGSNIRANSSLSELFKTGKTEISVGTLTYSMRSEEIKEFDRVQGYMYWLMDMTRFYNYTRQLTEMTEYAKEANNAKSMFLANMSHEIRTPMNAILGMNELIMRESENENIQGYAYNIDRAGHSLLSIINDILDITKIEAGRMELVYTRYDTASLINDVVNMTYQRAHDKGLFLKVEVDPRLPSQLIGDEIRLRQVFLNIVNNAIKYTREGGVTLDVTFVKINAEQSVTLIVKVMDTGIGIKPQDMQKLFRSFTRVDTNKNHAIEGTGLGLAITKELVELMGGSLEADSEYGMGSTFTVLLPQRVEKAEGVGEFAQRIKLRSASPKKGYTQSFTAPDASILLVDDNEMNLIVVRGLLNKTGVNIDTAESGAECLSRLKKKRYDLVLLDHMMPEMDGIQTLEKIKERKLAEGTPVVALTANAVSGARELYIGSGFDDFLSKPILPDKLEKLLRDYLPKELVTYYEPDEPGAAQKKGKSALPAIRGVDVQSGLVYSGGSMEAYIGMLTTFARVTKQNIEKLEKYAKEGDMSSYAILVHALKSTAASVGAKELAKSALLHEQKSKQRDNVFVFVEYKKLVAQINEVISSIQAYLSAQKQGAEAVDAKGVSPAELKEALADILRLFAELDDGAEKRIADLLERGVSKSAQAALSGALEAVQDYDFDKAAELLQELEGAEE